MSSSENSKESFRLAVVCGDGLPVSGLLTTFRNVIDLMERTSGCPPLIDLPIPVDLGYSWRPDKLAFFPHGSKDACYPSWFSVTNATPVLFDGYAEELLRIRQFVAQPANRSEEEKVAVKESIEAIALPYQQHFEEWFEANKVDWVCAINMTLSDSVSVSLALHRAAEKRWGKGKSGGLLFWDHDLLKSYAVIEDNKRVYPPSPNEFTPVPQDVPWHVWTVVSDLLAPETKHYLTKAECLVVPNLLPVIPPQKLDLHAPSITTDFLSRHGVLDGIHAGRPILLCPVRIFPVKGIEISIRLFTAIRKQCIRRNSPVPYLFIFGDPKEDPKYAAELQTLANDEGVSADVHFLGGVPISSGIYQGVGQLDEKDLLRIAATTKGGILFTPCTGDVESVGLGPALASVARIPCAVTKFNALHQVYGNGLRCVHVDTQGPQGFDLAAGEFVDLMHASAGEGVDWEKIAQGNSALMLEMFPSRPWKDLLLDLASRAGIDQVVISKARSALDNNN